MPRDKRADTECQRMEKERETKEDTFLVQAMMMDRVRLSFEANFHQKNVFLRLRHNLRLESWTKNVHNFYCEICCLPGNEQ